jgi:hypothetical protein
MVDLIRFAAQVLIKPTAWRLETGDQVALWSSEEPFNCALNELPHLMFRPSNAGVNKTVKSPAGQSVRLQHILRMSRISIAML